LQGLSPRERSEFSSLAELADIIGLRRLISRVQNAERYALWKADITRTAIRLYNSKIDDPRAQLIINPAMRDPYSSSPLIPGSSIKGAIRTAIVSELAKTPEVNPQLRKLKGKKLKEQAEPEILKYGKFDRRRNRYTKNLNRDPFRAVKVADAMIPKGSTVFARVHNYRPKAETKVAGFNMIYEFMVSRAEPITFETIMKIDEKLFSKMAQEYMKTSRHVRLDLKSIINHINSFYKKAFEDEREKFWEQASGLSLGNSTLFIGAIESAFENYSGPDMCVLRVGRFSQVEFVTIDNFRKPIGRRGKWGNSRMLVEIGRFLIPAGWLAIEFEEVD